MDAKVNRFIAVAVTHTKTASSRMDAYAGRYLDYLKNGIELQKSEVLEPT
jgi:hypothetical protein